MIRLLERISEKCNAAARSAAATGRILIGWDNLNFAASISEQRYGKSAPFQSGTASTITELWDPSNDTTQIDKALDLKLLQTTQAAAPPLALSDILPDREESSFMKSRFTYMVLKTLVDHGGEFFNKFQAKLRECEPSQYQIPLHKTAAHPLPTIPVEQASAVGNVTVLNTLVEHLKLEKNVLGQRLMLVFGDLLTVTRIRSIVAARSIRHLTPVHVRDFYESLTWLVPIPGLFHIKICAVIATLETHWGKPNSNDNPASLWCHNELLQRKHISNLNKIEYRTGKDIILHSLFARILDCIRVQSGSTSISTFAKDLAPLSVNEAWAQMAALARDVVDTFTVPANAGHDDPRRNSTLFMRDALFFWEYILAIKRGDMGSALIVLKYWTIAFQGAGRTKYAAELLHLCHNMRHAWPEDLKQLIINNLLVNMSGKPDGWKELDLLQEHMNYWIKSVYKAHGSNSTWSWLAMISTTITTLRDIIREVNRACSVVQTKAHTTPNLDQDLSKLMVSLARNYIHDHKGPPRPFVTQDSRAKDVLTEGGLNKPHKARYSPLLAFNSNLPKYTRDGGPHYSDQVLQKEPGLFETQTQESMDDDNLSDSDLSDQNDDDDNAEDGEGGQPDAEETQGEDNWRVTWDNPEDIDLDIEEYLNE
ncbi:hypothetical protein BOTBODRAFT_156492, partial [Botryobasidium botryosum FD-172 SS1]